MDEFYNGELVRLFPELAKRTSGTQASTPPNEARLPVLPPTQGQGVPERVSADEVEQFLGNPSTLLGLRLVHSLPRDQDSEQGESGAWEVTSYSVRKGDRGIEHQYQVSLNPVGDDPLPMDEEEVRHLLRHSSTLGMSM